MVAEGRKENRGLMDTSEAHVIDVISPFIADKKREERFRSW